MAMKLRSRPRTSVATKVAAGGLLLAAVKTFGPAYVIKGSWEGSLDDVKSLPEGLEPSTTGGISFSGDNIEFSLADGSMQGNYAHGPLSLAMNDGGSWQANYTQASTKVQFEGEGLGSVGWAASKSGKVAGLGDIELDVNSDGELEVSLTPMKMDLGGVGVQAHTKSSADGIAATLEASKSVKGLDVDYKVENGAGDYALSNLKHLLTAAAEVAGGKASAEYTYENGEQDYSVTYATAVAGGSVGMEFSDGASGQSYNVTFDRGLAALDANSDITLGVDADGMYSAASTSKAMGDITATFDTSARATVKGEDLSHSEALKLAHKLGTVTFSSADGGDVDISGDFAIDQAGNTLAAKVGYTVGGSDPTYNVTFSRDLSDVGAIELGVDTDGPYGSVSASKDIGSGFGVDYASSGRVNDLTHKLKLSSELGFAELVKAQDSDARVHLGYEFEV